jgi:hypothetical protein
VEAVMDFDPRDSDGRDDDTRWHDRDRAVTAPASQVRDTFSRDLDLPHGADRELVRDRDREYTLRGTETRTLATLGAFRVVSSRDLRDDRDRPLDPAQATCATCASKAWSKPCAWPGRGNSRSA